MSLITDIVKLKRGADCASRFSLWGCTADLEYCGIMEYSILWGVDRLRLRGNLILMMAAFLWGTTFVAQQSGMDSLGPFSYAASRYFLGWLTLLLVWFAYRGQRQAARKGGSYHSGWLAGCGAGGIMFIASSLQQVAMQYTTAGKTSFITCLYIIFVPVFAVVLRQRIKLENWIGAVLALAGLYLLCVRETFSLSYGDGLVLVSAVFWAIHILFTGRFAARVDVIEMSTAQIFVTMLASLAVALVFEDIQWSGLIAEAFPIFYAGVMSAGVAFTLQIIGQQYAEPSHAAIIMSLESVFGAVSSWLLLGEVMSGVEIMGCLLMITGMIVTQTGSWLLHKCTG